MNLCWAIFVILTCIFGVIGGREEQMTMDLLASGGDAVALCLSLTGAYALWCGILNIAKEAGLMDRLAKLLGGVMRLFPGVEKDAAARADIAANLAANLLGMGNAATPAGLSAVRRLHEPGRDTPTDSICMFLVVNTSSIQLLPTTVISLRTAAGAAHPADIVLPALLATACSTLSAILFMKLYFRWEGKGHGSRRQLAGAAAAAQRARARRAPSRRGL